MSHPKFGVWYGHEMVVVVDLKDQRIDVIAARLDELVIRFK